jgi:hypothetical protein
VNRAVLLPLMSATRRAPLHRVSTHAVALREHRSNHALPRFIASHRRIVLRSIATIFIVAFLLL